MGYKERLGYDLCFSLESEVKVACVPINWLDSD